MAEMTMVTASVMANSWNSRPTTSPMKSSGISTGDREDGSEMKVKANRRRPRQAPRSGIHAGFDIARDVLDHDDGVVDHEAGGDGQRHQRKIVEREAEQIHGAEGADQ